MTDFRSQKVSFFAQQPTEAQLQVAPVWLGPKHCLSSAASSPIDGPAHQTWPYDRAGISEMFICAEAKSVLCVKADNKLLSWALAEAPIAAVMRSLEKLWENQKTKRLLLKSFAIFPQQICAQAGGVLSDSHLLECFPASLFTLPESCFVFFFLRNANTHSPSTIVA